MMALFFVEVIDIMMYRMLNARLANTVFDGLSTSKSVHSVIYLTCI